MAQDEWTRASIKGHKLFVLAVAWTVLLGSAQPKAEQANGRPAHHQRGPTPKTASTPSPPPADDPSSNFRPYPDYKAERCYRASNHDTSDLCAYWRSAIAAEKAAHEARRANFWSIVASALSLATVIGLIVSILQTNGALREARRGNRLALSESERARQQSVEAAIATKAALAAAQKQVDVSEDTARLDLRAYVTAIGAITNLTKTEGYLKVKANVTLLNSGKTPAYLVTYRTKFHSEASRSSVRRTESRVIAPGAEVVLAMDFGTAFNGDKVENIYVRCFFEYKDTRGAIHTEDSFWSTGERDYLFLNGEDRSLVCHGQIDETIRRYIDPSEEKDEEEQLNAMIVSIGRHE